jgi:5-(carboxyamino)imidazole ribonucleotide mutase
MSSKFKVAVVMGSDSDWEIVREAAAVLRDFNIEHDVHVISAHRSPERAHTFATGARKAGYGAIIAAAGGAAHLAGVLCSLTTLPVIGIPIGSSALSGLDALYATVQMPSGVPVATMAIGKAGAKNAAVLAAQILSLSDPELAARLDGFKVELAQKVEKAHARVQEQIGAEGGNA